MAQEGNDEGEIRALCNRIREVGFALHTYLRHGHLEKAYENGLTHRLRKAGLRCEQQKALQVCDEDGTVLGDYFADLFVEDRLVVELKACKALANEHIAQILGYLRASRQRHALLINFGSPELKNKGDRSIFCPPAKFTREKIILFPQVTSASATVGPKSRRRGVTPATTATRGTPATQGSGRRRRRACS